MKDNIHKVNIKLLMKNKEEEKKESKNSEQKRNMKEKIMEKDSNLKKVHNSTIKMIFSLKLFYFPQINEIYKIIYSKILTFSTKFLIMVTSFISKIGFIFDNIILIISGKNNLIEIKNRFFLFSNKKKYEKTLSFDKVTHKKNFNLRNFGIKTNIKGNIIIRNNCPISNCILFNIIFINLFLIILSTNINSFIQLYFSSITLKIRGTENKNVYCKKFSDDTEVKYPPNEIIINGIKQNETKPDYFFDRADNVVDLIWNYTISSCKNLFHGCFDITEIDLSKFDTSEVTSCQDMFRGCTSLTSLNILNFSSAKFISKMFYNCLSLTSIDLSSFNIQVERMNSIFEGCENLEYINMSNFDGNSLMGFNDLFKNVPDNIVICLDENNIKNEILDQIKLKSCYTIDCSNDWKSKQKKMIKGNNTCFESCENSIQYKYEYNGTCLENCSHGYITDDNNSGSSKCKCELEKCLSCSPVSLNFVLCTKCNVNYYPKENDPLNIGEYIDCYKNPNGFYLDMNNSIYKKCYDTCETCDIKGDNIYHNCLKCNNDFSQMVIINNHTNCYENCAHYYYFDEENVYHCTSSSSCPSGYIPLSINIKQCIRDNRTIATTQIIQIPTTEINKEYTTHINKILTTEINKEYTTILVETDFTEKTTENIINKKYTTSLIEIITNLIESQKYINIIDIKNIINEIKKNGTQGKEDEILKYIESIFTSEYYNTNVLDNKIDEIIEIEKMIITFTTIENQKKI